MKQSTPSLQRFTLNLPPNVNTMPTLSHTAHPSNCQTNSPADQARHHPRRNCTVSLTSITGLEASAKGGGNILDIVDVSASFSYSQENSVKISREMEQRSSGSLVYTELSCATSKIQMAKYTFHPAFLTALSRLNSSADVVDMIEKYGSHFYSNAVLGGRLSQVTSVSSSFASSKTSSELEAHAKLSFGASVSSPIFSVSGGFSGSIDSSITTEQQEEFESSSTRSSVLTYGGPPGSFGPSSSDAPSNFGDWASAVDLLPVPIEYTLKKISDIIPDAWKSANGTSLRAMWLEGETLWQQKQTLINESK